MSMPEIQPQDQDPAGAMLAEAEGEADDRRGRLIGWGISAAVHALAILGLTLVVTATREIEKETPPVRVASIDPPPQPEERKQLERALEAVVEVAVEAKNAVDARNVTNLEVPVETVARETEVESPVPKGREEAVGDSEMGGAGAFMAIGAGGGGSGMFGARTGGGRKRAVGRGGGSKGSEAAVENALMWFVRHQSPDGSWPLMSYWKNCSEAGGRCEPGQEHRGPSDNIGVHGLIMLCFLGAGYDHMTPSRHRKVMQRATDWLLRQQKPEGEFTIAGARAHNYAQAMAVMALAESLAMTQDRRLRDPVAKGVEVMLARRVPAVKKGGVAWCWGDGQESSANAMATSATSWNIQALKSAVVAGVPVGDGWESGRQWLNAIWRRSVEAEGKDPGRLDPYKDQTGIAYRYNPEKDIISCFRGSPMTEDQPCRPGSGRNGHDLGCIGLLVGIFQGRTAGDPLIETLANYEMAYHLPTTYPCNNYYLYYNTLAMYQLGGERWGRWNGIVRDLLIGSQRKEPGCFDGSWNPGTHYSAPETGRLLSTALNCLSLEVYYRYAQVHGHDVAKRP
jgi:hypothetical protein